MRRLQEADNADTDLQNNNKTIRDTVSLMSKPASLLHCLQKQRAQSLLGRLRAQPSLGSSKLSSQL
jgi:hypothetical protein